MTDWFKRSEGFSQLELAAVLILCGILMVVLLNRLAYYQAAAEKANVEYTISMLKSALRSRMAALMIEGRAQETILLAEDNPMTWLEEKPGNYVGQFANPSEAEIADGNWYFDATSKILVYLVKHGNYFKPDSVGKKRVRLQVGLVRNKLALSNDVEAIEPTDTVALRLVEPYEWL